MSLLYIVDGYNVIQSSPAFSNKKLKEARESFLSYLNICRPQGSLRNRLIVVFDGTAEVYGPVLDCAFEVVFTRGREADDWIKEYIDGYRHPKSVVVVTDDRDLAKSIRLRGAKVMPTGDFLERGRRKKSKNKGVPSKVEGSELNIVQREEITQEMSRRWLDK